jgi:PIN domain nuclease of toxin-antitoxin system
VILLDTHVLLWLALAPDRLSRPARRALKAPRLLADISLREVAALERAGRLAIDGSVGEWLGDALQELAIQVVPIDVHIAARSVRIAANFHGDPADQLIAATSIELDVALVTADQRLRESAALRTVW